MLPAPHALSWLQIYPPGSKLPKRRRPRRFTSPPQPEGLADPIPVLSLQRELASAPERFSLPGTASAPERFSLPSDAHPHRSASGRRARQPSRATVDFPEPRSRSIGCHALTGPRQHRSAHTPVVVIRELHRSTSEASFFRLRPDSRLSNVEQGTRPRLISSDTKAPVVMFATAKSL